MIGGTEYQQAQTPFGRTGGKSRLAEKIIGLFPETSEYNTFVEPFVGAGNIFFRTVKDPRITEVINDKDIRVIRILRALKKDPISFNDKIKRDYISKEYYESIKGSIKPEDNLITLKNSFRSNGISYVNARLIKTDYSKNYGERLADTTILSEDYTKVLHKYDSPKTLFYLDPPYESKTKTDYRDYTEPEDIWDSVKNLKGFVAVSYNDSPKIRELFKTWNIRELKTKYIRPDATLFDITELFITNYLK